MNKYLLPELDVYLSGTYESITGASTKCYVIFSLGHRNLNVKKEMEGDFVDHEGGFGISQIDY